MPRKIVDKTGRRYDMLTVIELAGRSEKGEALWKCRCDCGNEVIKPSKLLQEGKTMNCGCIAKMREEERVKLKAERKIKMMQEARKRAELAGQESIGKWNTSLCWHCIHSAAPPSLQCVWDKTKGQQLPEGAEKQHYYRKTGKENEVITEATIITSCPEFLSVYDKANAELLKAERQKNAEEKAKERERIYASAFQAKSGQSSGDWWKVK